jgi:hypothetical protein
MARATSTLVSVPLYESGAMSTRSGTLTGRA